MELVQQHPATTAPSIPIAKLRKDREEFLLGLHNTSLNRPRSENTRPAFGREYCTSAFLSIYVKIVRAYTFNRLAESTWQLHVGPSEPQAVKKVS